MLKKFKLPRKLQELLLFININSAILGNNKVFDSCRSGRTINITSNILKERAIIRPEIYARFQDFGWSIIKTIGLTFSGKKGLPRIIIMFRSCRTKKFKFHRTRVDELENNTC